MRQYLRLVGKPTHYGDPAQGTVPLAVFSPLDLWYCITDAVRLSACLSTCGVGAACASPASPELSPPPPLPPDYGRAPAPAAQRESRRRRRVAERPPLDLGHRMAIVRTKSGIAPGRLLPLSNWLPSGWVGAARRTHTGACPASDG